MDDQTFITRLLEIGVEARRSSSDAYANPADHRDLTTIGVARLANWLETLGGRGLVGDVQPCFTMSGAGFRFQVTDEAANVLANPSRLQRFLNDVAPLAPEFDLFISYAAGDSHIAGELRGELESGGLKCFMAEKDIRAASEWQDSIRQALIGSKRLLVLLTPRSVNRPVLLETGAAWALGKPLIPALSHIAADDLTDPLRRYQVRVIETSAQRSALVRELTIR